MAHLFGLFIFVIGSFSFAALPPRLGPQYYGAEFLNEYQTGQLQDSEIADKLHVILISGHIQRDNAPDEIVHSCEKSELKLFSGNPNRCRQHASIGYERAKQKLFGILFLNDHGGSYSLSEVYCEKNYTDADFGGNKTIFPGWKPANADLLNTEHTWPQSRFTSRFPKDMQKADLHHLFPTDTKMNSSRGAFRFGNVLNELDKLKCKNARLGHPQGSSEIVFEAPVAHRGNVARAIFYFAIRYQMKVSPAEKATLIQWNDADPVDTEELKRNDLIEQAQGNRNPFVDFPDLVSRLQGI